MASFVNGQPQPTLFFNIYLELEKKSLLTYMAFDSKSIKALLDPKNEDYFGDEFPLFYK